MYFINDDEVFFLEIEKPLFKEEELDLILNKHKKIPVDVWKVKEILERDGHFYRLFDTNFLAKINENIIYIFEVNEIKEIPEENRLLLKLSFKGAYIESSEEELEEELNQSTAE